VLGATQGNGMSLGRRDDAQRCGSATEIGGTRAPCTEFPPGSICTVPFAETWTVVDRVRHINQKTAPHNLAAKKRETQMARRASGWLFRGFFGCMSSSGGGHGWNSGSGIITAVYIFQDNWYPTHRLVDDCEGGKRDA
jgi:hypothetical protein